MKKIKVLVEVDVNFNINPNWIAGTIERSLNRDADVHKIKVEIIKDEEEKHKEDEE